MNSWEATLDSARRAIEEVAQCKGTSVEHVRKHIQSAIISGMTCPDPEVRSGWENIPRAGEYPTPEELIAYGIMRLRGKRRDVSDLDI